MKPSRRGPSGGSFVAGGVGLRTHVAAGGDCYHSNYEVPKDEEKRFSQRYRKHGMRSKVSSENRLKTTLTFKPGFQAYHWATDRSRDRGCVVHILGGVLTR